MKNALLILALISLIACNQKPKYRITATDKLEIATKNLKLAKKESDTLMCKVYLDQYFYSLEDLIKMFPDSAQAKIADSIINNKQFYFNKITERQKKSDSLKIAEEKQKIELQKEKKEKLSKSLKKLRIEKDDFKEISWYYDRNTPKYSNYNSMHIYMGQIKESEPFLRLRIQYASDDWLFIETYIIKTDNNNYTISTSYGDVERDNGSGGIWEWYDVLMTKEYYGIIKDIISSKNVKIRYNGKQYYKDRTISEKEKQGFKNILDAYGALEGTFKF